MLLKAKVVNSGIDRTHLKGRRYVFGVSIIRSERKTRFDSFFSFEAFQNVMREYFQIIAILQHLLICQAKLQSIDVYFFNSMLTRKLKLKGMLSLT